MATQGLQPLKREIDEEFRFGGGDTVKSKESFIYFIGINQQRATIEVASVPGSTPTLLSQDSMGDMGMLVNYGKRTMDIPRAKIRNKPIRHSPSGHMLLNIYEYEDPKKVHRTFQVASRALDPVPLAIQEEDGFPDPLFGFGTDISRMSRIGVVSRGHRRQLKRASKQAKEILATDVLETSRRATARQGPSSALLATGISAQPSKAVAPISPPRKKPKFLEVFTWTMVLSAAAYQAGWTCLQPITAETGYNLYTHAGRVAAWKIIREEKPDVVAMAWPCDPWTIMDNAHYYKSSKYAAKLEA